MKRKKERKKERERERERLGRERKGRSDGEMNLSCL